MGKKIVPDEISAGTFMCMKENVTTIPHKNQGSYNMKSLKSYRTYLSYSWQTCQQTKMDKEEMENNTVVMHQLDKEAMSWKTMTLWQGTWQKQKENKEELILPPLHKHPH